MKTFVRHKLNGVWLNNSRGSCDQSYSALAVRLPAVYVLSGPQLCTVHRITSCTGDSMEIPRREKLRWNFWKDLNFQASLNKQGNPHSSCILYFSFSILYTLFFRINIHLSFLHFKMIDDLWYKEMIYIYIHELLYIRIFKII